MCWRRLLNVLEIKYALRAALSLLFLASTVNDVRHQKKATYGRNTLDCRKTSKKNARCYSQDYCLLQDQSVIAHLIFKPMLNMILKRAIEE